MNTPHMAERNGMKRVIKEIDKVITAACCEECDASVDGRHDDASIVRSRIEELIKLKAHAEGIK